MGDLPSRAEAPLSLEAALYDTKSGRFSPTVIKQPSQSTSQKPVAGSQQPAQKSPRS